MTGVSLFSRTHMDGAFSIYLSYIAHARLYRYSSHNHFSAHLRCTARVSRARLNIIVCFAFHMGRLALLDDSVSPLSSCTFFFFTAHTRIGRALRHFSSTLSLFSGLKTLLSRVFSVYLRISSNILRICRLSIYACGSLYSYPPSSLLFSFSLSWDTLAQHGFIYISLRFALAPLLLYKKNASP